MDLTFQKERVSNLRLLVQEFGTQKAVGDNSGLASAYVNQLLNKERPIGEKTARKLEIGANKPRYWLDKTHPHNQDTESEKIIEKITDTLLHLGKPDLKKTLMYVDLFDADEDAKSTEQKNSIK